MCLMGTPPPGLLSWQPCSLTPPPLSRSSEESPTRACSEKISPLSAGLEKSLSRASAKRNPNARQLRMDGAGLTVVQRPSVCKLNGLNNHIRHHHSQHKRSSSDRTEEVVGTYECRQLQSLQSNPFPNPSTNWNGNALPHLVLHRKLHRHPAVICSAAAAAAGGDGALFSSDLGTDTAGDGAIFSSDLSTTTNGGAYESRGKFCTLSKPPNGLFCRMDCYCCWIQVCAVVLSKTHMWILCRISIFVLRFKCTYSFWNYRFSHGLLPRKKNRIFLQKQSYVDGSIASVGLLCKIATLTAQVCHVQRRMRVMELQHRQRI